MCYNINIKNNLKGLDVLEIGLYICYDINTKKFERT